MSDWKDRRAPALTAIAVSCCCWLWSGQRAAAQTCADDNRPLIVVADARDAEFVRRIGGKAVEVESLFLAEAAFDPADYDACNARAHAVREFSVYFVNTAICCPRERFWRERLSQANPGGHVHWIGPRHVTPEHDCQRAAQQATDIHQALVTGLPRHRETFDANLMVELARLQRLRVDRPRLASGN